jgi:hypothetical protein
MPASSLLAPQPFKPAEIDPLIRLPYDCFGLDFSLGYWCPFHGPFDTAASLFACRNGCFSAHELPRVLVGAHRVILVR